MRRFLLLAFFVLIVCFAQTSEARKLALLVGVDSYVSVPSLKCCVNDMKTLKEALMKIEFEEDDIQMLVTGGAFKNMPTKKRTACTFPRRDLVNSTTAIFMETLALESR